MIRRSLGMSILFVLVFSTHIVAQDTVKTAYGIKVFGGAILFPSPTLSYPSPLAGIGGSVFINSFEIEAGISYYRKYDLQAAKNNPGYQSISYIQDYLNFHALVNIKISQEKKHIISGYAGLNVRKNLSWSSDTLLPNGSYNRNSQIKTLAEGSVGVSLIGGLRYTYIANKKLNLVTGVDIGIAVEEEYYVPPKYTQDPHYPKPIEPKFQLGVSLGLQFMLSKNRPRFLTER